MHSQAVEQPLRGADRADRCALERCDRCVLCHITFADLAAVVGCKLSKEKLPAKSALCVNKHQEHAVGAAIAAVSSAVCCGDVQRNKRASVYTRAKSCARVYDAGVYAHGCITQWWGQSIAAFGLFATNTYIFGFEMMMSMSATHVRLGTLRGYGTALRT